MADGPLPAPPRYIASLAVHSQRVFRLSCVFFLVCAVGSLVLFWPILIKEDFEAYLQCDGPQHGRLCCGQKLEVSRTAWGRESLQRHQHRSQHAEITSMTLDSHMLDHLFFVPLLLATAADAIELQARPAGTTDTLFKKLMESNMVQWSPLLLQAVAGEKKGTNVEEREKMSMEILDMQSEVSKVQATLDHLRSAVDSCGDTGEECAHPRQCCQGVQCCADGTQCCDSGNCCAANDVCCHGGCCSQGNVCCANGLCGAPGSRCQDGLVLAPPISVTAAHAKEAVEGAKKVLEKIESEAFKARCCGSVSSVRTSVNTSSYKHMRIFLRVCSHVSKRLKQHT
ncbi:unnamed protein product [Symbiodinium natans]|uniref:Uncharacterized protein n=1 Tax=Symbiodinium natans TaxID=878477 RepID=A0A812UTJ5_9DINO|nr:unnamed protein product [Symbiodinium natans]